MNHKLFSKLTHDSSKLTHDSSKLTHDSSKLTHDSSKLTHDSSKLTHDSSKLTHDSSKLTHDSSKLISFYNSHKIIGLNKLGISLKNLKRLNLVFQNKGINKSKKQDINKSKKQGINKSKKQGIKSKKQGIKSKKKGELRLYFNNIDTCSLKNRLKDKDNMIQILKLLGKEHHIVLNKIYITFKFSKELQDAINIFLLKEIYKMSFDDCVEWVNLNGIELRRGIYIFYLDGKLPIEINKLMGDFPQTKGEFTSLDIQNEIQLSLKNSKKIELTRDGITLNLLIFYDNISNSTISNSTISNSTISNSTISEELLMRCFYLDLLLKSRTKINLEIWLSNKKKNLPLSDRQFLYIGAKEVNSGCSSFTDEGNKISVWRKEELPKVLIHEIIHSLSLEKHNDYGELIEFFYKVFDLGIDNKLNLFECYVEIMAEIVNIFLIVNKFGKEFNKLLKLEINHCLFQVGKILNYFGYKDWNEFHRESGHRESKKSGKYMQKSNVFSYFIFRSLIMYNINDFIDLCFDKNKKHFLKQEFPSIDLLNIVKKTLKDKSYINNINKFILLNKKANSNKKTKSKLEYNNLRITCIEKLL